MDERINEVLRLIDIQLATVPDNPIEKTESIQNAKKCYRILQKNINFRSWQWR